MELGIPNAPAGGLATNTNTGYATILDQSSFDPVTFMQNYNAQRKADEIAKAKDGMARAAKWKDYKLPDIKDIYWTNQQEIDDAITKMSDVAAEYAANGGDPDSPEFKKILVPLEQSLIQAQNEGKDLFSFVSGLYEKAAADPSKYDPEELGKWVEGLKAQPTLADKYKYKENNPIFTPKFNIYETLGKILPAESVQERLLGNGQSVVTTGYDRPTMKKFIEENVAALKLTNPAEMQKTFEDGVANGQWKTPDEMIESLTNTAMTWGQTKKEYQGTSGGGLSISFGGDGASTGDFNFLKGKETTDESLDQSGDMNFVTISYKGADAKPVTVYNDNKEGIAFVPTRYIKDKGGFWRVQGKSGKSQAVYKTEEEAQSFARGRDNAYVVQNGNNYEVIVLDTKTISVPLNETNKRTLQNHFGGFDVIEFEKKTGGKSGAKKEKNTTFDPNNPL